MSFARVLDDRERLEVTGIGGEGDFGITIEAGDALGHREPTDDSFAFTIAMTASEKTIRMIDDGFDAEDDAELGIHFDPVFADAVFNAHAFGPGFEIGNDFGSEVGSDFFTEEGQDIGCAETKAGVFEKFTGQRIEGVLVFEHDIGGEFSLISCPIIGLSGEDIFEERIDKSGEFLKEGGPVETAELIGQILGLVGIGDFDKGIINLFERDVVTAHLDGEPFMAIDGNLNDERKPGLDADVDKAELGMDEIIIETEAFAVCGKDTWPADAIADFEGGTGFQFGKDADQTAGNVQFLSDAAGFIVLADMAREILIRAVMFCGHGFGVQNQAIGLSLDELGEILDFEAAGGYKLIQTGGIIDGSEMSFEDDAVKAIECAGNLGDVFFDKQFHGVLSGCFVDDVFDHSSIYGMDATLWNKEMRWRGILTPRNRCGWAE